MEVDLEDLSEKVLGFLSNEGWVRVNSKTLIDPNGYEVLTTELLKEVNNVLACAITPAELGQLMIEGIEPKKFLKKVLTELPAPKVNSDTDYALFINAPDNEDYIWDITKGDMVKGVIAQAFLRVVSPNRAKGIEANKMLGEIVFNPYSIDKVIDTTKQGMPFTIYNQYEPPEWRLLRAKPVPDKRIVKILRHLFNNDVQQIEYLYDWLHRAILSRNEVCLVLNGRKGIGKGILVDNIIKALIGLKYFTLAPESLLTSHFNAVLKNNRLIFLDEFKVDKIMHTKLKRFLNKNQSVEEKGKDARDMIETYNSFIIANNDECDMYIEHDDRRFSVMEMTDIPLNKVMETKEITKFARELEEDPSIIAGFGQFLVEREPTTDTFHVLKHEKFHRLITVALTEWQKAIFYHITNGCDGEDVIEVDEIKGIIRRYNPKSRIPGPDKVKDFINGFVWKDGERLGTYGQGEIRVNPKYVKEDSTSSEFTVDIDIDDEDDDSVLDLEVRETDLI